MIWNLPYVTIKGREQSWCQLKWPQSQMWNVSSWWDGPASLLFFPRQQLSRTQLSWVNVCRGILSPAQGPVVMDSNTQRGAMADKLGQLYKVDNCYFWNSCQWILIRNCSTSRVSHNNKKKVHIFDRYRVFLKMSYLSRCLNNIYQVTVSCRTGAFTIWTLRQPDLSLIPLTFTAMCLRAQAYVACWVPTVPSGKKRWIRCELSRS